MEVRDNRVTKKITGESFEEIMVKHSRAGDDAVILEQFGSTAVIIFDSESDPRVSAPAILWNEGFYTFKDFAQFEGFLDSEFELEDKAIAGCIQKVNIEMKFS